MKMKAKANSKTYTEALGEKPFDWNKALSAKFGKMTISKLDKMQDKAASWVTCACGNQCDVIPRFPGGRPVDGKLAEDGDRFTIAVANLRLAKTVFIENAIGEQFRHDAIVILDRIEKRSAVLIEKELEAQARGTLSEDWIKIDEFTRKNIRK
jgi:hypothetical protein